MTTKCPYSDEFNFETVKQITERGHRMAAFGKLRVCFERTTQTHLALLSLACSVICIRSLPQFC